MEARAGAKTTRPLQNDAEKQTTYIGKYGCHEPYYKLKLCLEENSANQASVGLCDQYHDLIGQCIIDSYRKMNGEGIEPT